MSVDVKWGNKEHTIVQYTYQGLLTAEDHAMANEKTIRMLESVDHPVTFISNLLELKVPPNMVSQYSQVNRLEMFINPKVNLIVVVTVSGLLDVMVQIFGTVYKERMSKIKLVKNEEEAFRVCEEHLAAMRGRP